MLGKVIVVAGGAGAALLLRTRAAREQYARLRESARAVPLARRQTGTAPVLVDRRPQALENSTAAPLLLPDATPVEIARAVSEEQSRPS